ncbi:hypothetical protein MtrunA17_Chr7g0255831 [Medicago truncatula]|uniref:Uncharacterized protein n=1 Tax=Medicago truncatula TaxID=3880 RepID=A2Q4K1_MEDTR|nr:hypothetical protein MtrDRAFT_AC157502g16v2 [Medicago truncatula]RHN47703.1 hypothetical protein MtrunA17_Chr7g0255831 [Medicago truncatula]
MVNTIYIKSQSREVDEAYDLSEKMCEVKCGSTMILDHIDGYMEFVSRMTGVRFIPLIMQQEHFLTKLTHETLNKFPIIVSDNVVASIFTLMNSQSRRL